MPTPVAITRAAWTLALVLLATTAGCMADLERLPLNTEWDAAPEALASAPTLLLDEAPAQAHIAGPINITPSEPVRLTGLEASITVQDQQIPLTAARLDLEDGFREPADVLAEEPPLQTGASVQMTLLPRQAEHIPLDPDHEVNLTAHLQYRYRDGDAFDAGRLTMNATLRPQPAQGPTLGTPRTTDAGVHEIVFKDLNNTLPEGPTQVQAFHVGDTVELDATIDGNLTHGEGVTLLTLDAAHETRQGDGYTLYRLDTEPPLVAASPDQAGQDPLPMPVALVALALLSAASLTRRHR